MGAIVKLDQTIVRNRLGWKPAEGLEIEKPKLSRDYKAVLAGFDGRAAEDKLRMVVNQKLSLPLDCSVEPRTDYYHVLIAINPELLANAEVVAPSILLPESGRVQPTLHIRALRSFDLRDFEWAASIHLVD